MAAKKIGDLGEDLVLGGALIAGFFFVLKPALDLFGANPEDVATIDRQKAQAPTANCFSYQFAPFVNNFNANPSYNQDGSVMSMQTYYQIVKANNDAGTPVLGLNNINIAQLGENLISALSPWVLATDSNNVFAVFGNFNNQTQIASMAAYLMFNYNKDLLSMLTGSIFKVGLGPADLATLIHQVNALPVQ